MNSFHRSLQKITLKERKRMNIKFYRNVLAMMCGLTLSTGACFGSSTVPKFEILGNCGELGECEKFGTTTMAVTTDQPIETESLSIEGGPSMEELDKTVADIEAKIAEVMAVDFSSVDKKKHQKHFTKTLERMLRDQEDFMKSYNAYKELADDEYTKEVRRERKKLAKNMEKEYKKLLEWHKDFNKYSMKYLS